MIKKIVGHLKKKKDIGILYNLCDIWEAIALAVFLMGKHF